MKNKIVKELISWIICIGSGLLIAFLLITFVFRFTIVKGDSMRETLHTNQVLYIDKLTYNFSHPQRGDIIVCNYPGYDDNFIKRIIGLPGETIYIKNSVVYINGNSGVDVWNSDHEIGDINPVTIPEGCYFVMGDNRSNSKDSRDRTVGAISEDKILGKAVFSLFPINTFGTIKFKSWKK